jgi:uncharacterized protein (DUF983 family)
VTSPYLAGAMGRCPNCGQGKLFKGFLQVAPVCQACGYDLSRADSGDGPAIFVIMIAGFLMAFGALFSLFAFHWPAWLALAFWLPMTVVVCLGLLRPMKGLLVAAQFTHKASQAGRHDV